MLFSCPLQVKWLYYILILFSHLIYAITYSIYVVLVFNSVCKPHEDDLKRFTWNNRMFFVSKCDFEGRRTATNFALTAWIFLILFNIMYLMKETTKLLHLRGRYFKEWESVLNLLTIITFPMISFHSNPFVYVEPPTFVGWQYHAAGIGVLITWILQMFLIGKVPRFGKYVQMLLTVAWSFFNFFVAYSSLIAGFALAFVVLFPREVAFDEILGAPIKVMVMMTGEIEYNDLYYPQKQIINFTTTNKGNESDGFLHGVGDIQEVTEPQFFPVTAHAILTVFILIVSIVIMNLLFGMAVSDVQVKAKRFFEGYN
jgi:ABC-type multidrug transport system fused ATPase/permease subunit